MATEIELKKISTNYRIQKNSTVIISFIGIAFILLASINFIVDVPAEYLIGISFAAFFFVMADFTIMAATTEKPFKEKLYYSMLFLAVMSFILLPVLLPFISILFNWIASSSESVSIASLGIVLVMMNLKLWKAEEEFFDEFHKLSDKNEAIFDDLETKLNSSYEKIDESLEIARIATKNAEEINTISREVHELNKKFIKLIEEGETLEEIREKIKSYK